MLPHKKKGRSHRPREAGSGSRVSLGGWRDRGSGGWGRSGGDGGRGRGSFALC